MIRFIVQGWLWVYTAWCAGGALGALILSNTADVIAYGLWTAAGVLGLIASHQAHRQRQRIHGDES